MRRFFFCFAIIFFLQILCEEEVCRNQRWWKFLRFLIKRFTDTRTFDKCQNKRKETNNTRNAKWYVTLQSFPATFVGRCLYRITEFVNMDLQNTLAVTTGMKTAVEREEISTWGCTYYSNVPSTVRGDRCGMDRSLCTFNWICIRTI